jgi:hypothetical protein
MSFYGLDDDEIDRLDASSPVRSFAEMAKDYRALQVLTSPQTGNARDAAEMDAVLKHPTTFRNGWLIQRVIRHYEVALIQVIAALLYAIQRFPWDDEPITLGRECAYCLCERLDEDGQILEPHQPDCEYVRFVQTVNALCDGRKS